LRLDAYVRIIGGGGGERENNECRKGRGEEGTEREEEEEKEKSTCGMAKKVPWKAGKFFAERYCTGTRRKEGTDGRKEGMGGVR
jgi:hypothetical protein